MSYHYNNSYYVDYEDYFEEEFEEEDEINFIIPKSELPSRLYRVLLPIGFSSTRYSSAQGFKAKKTGYLDVKDPRKLFDAVRSHLNWESEEPSPFISTFNSKSHAVSWGLSWISKNPEEQGAVKLVEIDPRRITTGKGTLRPILSVGDMVSEIEGLLPGFMTEDQVEDEFLVLQEIPKKAIIRVVDIYVAEVEVADFDFIDDAF
ncbi:hypothetical protein ABW19_dt0206584 [Dactylella cylindrospora]|nr:hypothetical protein ABW19_dt0206584 [Dactylella cylindrospora]